MIQTGIKDKFPYFSIQGLCFLYQYINKFSGVFFRFDWMEEHMR